MSSRRRWVPPVVLLACVVFVAAVTAPASGTATSKHDAAPQRALRGIFGLAVCSAMQGA